MLYKLLYIAAWSGFTVIIISSFLKYGEEYLWNELKRISSEYISENNSNCTQYDISLLRKLFEEVYHVAMGMFRATIILLGAALYGIVLVGGIVFFT